MARPKSTAKPPQTFNEIVESNKNIRATSKLYKAQSLEISDDRISDLINKTTAELVSISTEPPITLNDTDKVKQRTFIYLKACEAASVFPSMSGFARSLGMSRLALYDFRNHMPNHPTSKWIDMMSDTFSDILTESALRNNCNSIVSIFINKAVYGLRESLEIVTPTHNPLGIECTKEDLIEKVRSLPTYSEEDL